MNALLELRHFSSVDTRCYHSLDLSLFLNDQKSSGSEQFIFRCEESGFLKNGGDMPIYFTLEDNSGSSFSAAPKQPISVTLQPAQWFSLTRCGYTCIATGRKQQVYYAKISMLAYITDIRQQRSPFIMSSSFSSRINKKGSRNLLSSALADW